MKFTGGQTCWNGPARSSAVFLHCGGENTLTAVSEPNRSAAIITRPSIFGSVGPMKYVLERELREY